MYSSDGQTVTSLSRGAKTRDSLATSTDSSIRLAMPSEWSAYQHPVTQGELEVSASASGIIKI